jgi:hypothetical protein
MAVGLCKNCRHWCQWPDWSKNIGTCNLADDGPTASLHFLGLSCRDKSRSEEFPAFWLISEPTTCSAIEERDARPVLWTDASFGCVSFEPGDDT